MPKIEENEVISHPGESISCMSALLAQYLALFPEERHSLQRLQKQLDDHDTDLYSRKNMKGHLTASAILLDSERRSIFLVYHRFLKLWLQPGGHLDLFEDPLAGAFREFIEETGMKRVKLHEWHRNHPEALDMDTHFIPENKNKGEGQHYHHDFQYLFALDDGTENAVISIAEDEISQFRWVALEELHKGDFDPRLKRVAKKIEQFILL